MYEYGQVLPGQTSKSFAHTVSVSHQALVAANPDVFDDDDETGFIRRFKRLCFGRALKSRTDPDDYILPQGIVLKYPKIH